VAADPASGAVPKDWVFGTELPQEANRHVRHRMFAIVDRTAFGDDSQDRVGPFFEFKSNRLPPSEADDGRKYKMLVAPLVLEPDGIITFRDPNDPSDAGGTYEGTHVLYQDVFIPA
jgi:hypothetical protein